MNLYVSLSALYTLQYVPIVTYSCKLLYSKNKKKTKNKKKKTRISVWVKIPKLCHNTLLSIFSLGKGRESLCLKTLHKKLSKSALSALPPARNIQIRTMCGRRMPKLPKISLLFREFCTFPVTEGYAIWHSNSSSQPWQESLPTERNLSMQKDTNFGNTIILWYFRPEKCQKSYPERHEFWERHDSSAL